MAQSVELWRGPLAAGEIPRLDAMWAAKWSAILLLGCVGLAAPFVLKAYVTKKPGTIWAER